MTAMSDETSPLLAQNSNRSYNGDERNLSSAEQQPEEPQKLTAYFIYVSA
jgi:hypothetical protein